MNGGEAKLDADVRRTLDQLTATAQIDVLVYPKQITPSFKQYLQKRREEGVLEYNILHLANCAVVKASKQVILEIAARDDVARIGTNPRFTLP